MTLRLATIEQLPPMYREQASRKLARKTVPHTGPAAKKRMGDEEHAEQVEFIKKIRALAQADNRYAAAADRTYAIPNGGKRGKRQAGRLKAEGVRAGVPDLFVSLPCGPYHGLYIEMKSLTGKPSREQAAWLADSARLGYQAVCCSGAAEAVKAWREYVEASIDPISGANRK